MTIAQIGPAHLDIEVPRGDDIALVFLLKADGEALDLGDDQFEMVIGWPDHSLVKESESGSLILLPAAGQIRCPLSAAETGALPEGRIAQYELARHGTAGQRTYLAGHLIARGGLNHD